MQCFTAFSPFPTMFSEILFLLLLVVKPYPKKPIFLCVCNTSLLTILGKDDFFPFRTVFYTLMEVFSILMENLMSFSSNSKLASKNSLILEESKMLFGKWLKSGCVVELTHYHTIPTL